MARTREAGNFLFFSLIVFFVVLVDQVCKFVVSKTFVLNSSVPLINNVLHLTFLQNFGAGFSVLQGFTWLFVLIALFFIVVVVVNYGRIPPVFYVRVGFALFLAGTISNLIDRLVFGFVIDYLNFKIFLFSNNLADIALTVGAVLIVYYWLFGDKLKKKVRKKSKRR